MSQVGNTNPEQVGGEFMIQDRDHMSGQSQQAGKTGRGQVRQSDQSHEESRQQGDARKGDKTRRQSH